MPAYKGALQIVYIQLAEDDDVYTSQLFISDFVMQEDAMEFYSYSVNGKSDNKNIERLIEFCESITTPAGLLNVLFNSELCPVEVQREYHYISKPFNVYLIGVIDYDLNSDGTMYNVRTNKFTPIIKKQTSKAPNDDKSKNEETIVTPFRPKK